MKKTISLILVLALGLATEVANADFNFGEPVNLKSVIPVIDPGLDYSICFSFDGLEMYIGSDRPGGHGWGDLWVLRRDSADTDWAPPENLGPAVNSPDDELSPCISADGLELYFISNRPGGYGGMDIYMTTRATRNDPWRQPVNLGPKVSSPDFDTCPWISSNGLELYVQSNRPGGYGGFDIYVSRRATTNDAWGDVVNLGPVVNSAYNDAAPSLSPDELLLFFQDFGTLRPGGYGGGDMWMARRANLSAPWEPPVNLGPVVNSATQEQSPKVSPDGSTLYFGTSGAKWQAPIIPVVDFNIDGIVDAKDMCIMVDHWGESYSFCDIGPMPWGDGIVDIQDLIVLAEHLSEESQPVELEEVNVDEGDDSSQVELEQGQILVVTLESNPTTGYRWEVVETQESILEQMGEAEFKPSQTGEPPLVGAGGWEIFRFKGISAGQMTLKLGYHRPWEEGVEPIKTFSIQVVVN